MKYIALSFILSFVLLSCSSNNGTEISQQEFQHILATDTIESITTNDDSEFARIKIRGGKDNEYLLLRISSNKNFQDSLDLLIDSLADNYNIHPIICSSSHVGSTIPAKDVNLLYDQKIWLMLLTLPFILIVYYEVKGKRKRKKK